MHATIEACQETIVECQAVISEMVRISSKTECPRCCVVTSEICQVAVNEIAREGEFAGRISSLCAEICTWCAHECRREGHDHCVRCAEACDRCVEALAQVAD
jgi:hypothetical protein